jgi:YesN/AraC family two-component response regulator
VWSLYVPSRHFSVAYQNPYYHVFLIDAKVYNDVLKKKIADFIQEMKEKHYHYLLLCIPSTSSVKKSTIIGKPYVVDKVYDGIKKDFSDAIRLTTSENLMTLSAGDLGDVAHRVTDEVMHEFVKRKKRFEREAKQSEETKNLVGWNYHHYFLHKEMLLSIFNVLDCVEHL